MSSSSTPPTRPTGYTNDATGSSGSTSTIDRDRDQVATDPDVKAVRPRGHVRDDLGLLVLRLGLAAVMLAHGYQKFILQGGVGGTTQAFTQMGLPYPQVSAVVIVVLELAGGVAMVFGLFTVLVGLAYAAAMAAAVYFVHLPNGFFVAQNGYELAALTGVVALALAVTGAGTISLDRALFGAKRRRRVREARDAGLV